MTNSKPPPLTFLVADVQPAPSLADPYPWDAPLPSGVVPVLSGPAPSPAEVVAVRERADAASVAFVAHVAVPLRPIDPADYGFDVAGFIGREPSPPVAADVEAMLRRASGDDSIKVLAVEVVGSELLVTLAPDLGMFDIAIDVTAEECTVAHLSGECPRKRRAPVKP